MAARAPTPARPAPTLATRALAAPVYVAIGGVEADQTAGLTRLETGEGEAQPAEGAVVVMAVKTDVVQLSGVQSPQPVVVVVVVAGVVVVVVQSAHGSEVVVVVVVVQSSQVTEVVVVVDAVVVVVVVQSSQVTEVVVVVAGVVVVVVVVVAGQSATPAETAAARATTIAAVFIVIEWVC